MSGAVADGRSALYAGWVRHRRHAPVAHGFSYPVLMALLDLDAIEAVMARSWLTSRNRLNLASFFDRDHLDRADGPMRPRLAADAAQHGIALPEGPVLLLTQLRYAGYVFNPVSFYYCYDGEHRLAAVMAEVNNTFGGTHHYWLTVEPGGHEAGSRVFHAAAGKALYVSPFMPPDLRYHFVFTEPEATLSVHTTAIVEGETTTRFDATLLLTRHAWTAATIRRLLLRHPLATFKVIAAIHWEAWRLWCRGVPVVPREHPRGLLSRHRAGSDSGGLPS